MLGVGAGLIVLLVLSIGASSLFAVFGVSEAVRAEGVPYLRVLAFAAILAAATAMFRSKWVFYTSTVSGYLVVVPLSWLLAIPFGWELAGYTSPGSLLRGADGRVLVAMRQRNWRVATI